jgi:hypothetical protein
MKLDAHIDALISDLSEVSAIGDRAAAEAGARIAAALRHAAGIRLLGAITEAALEVSAQLPSGHVDVRLAGRDPTLVYSDAQTAPGPDRGDDGFAARITLRLPESLKASVEDAAARESLSVNAWLVRALTRAVAAAPSRRGPGSRLTGFARS